MTLRSSASIAVGELPRLGAAGGRACGAAAPRRPGRCRRCRRWTAWPRAGGRAASRTPWPVQRPGVGTKSESAGSVGMTRSEVAPRAARRQLGVGLEGTVQVADVARVPARGGPRARPGPGSGSAARAVGVGDVAGRLLEVGHQPAPLEDLGEQVRDALAGEVHAAELGDGVVAVLEEHPVVELLGAPQADGGVDGAVAGDVELVDELVEEEPAQALGRARVAGEQRALHHLGQVDEREDGAVEVREVGRQELALVLRERLAEGGSGHPRAPLAAKRSRRPAC